MINRYVASNDNFDNIWIYQKLNFLVMEIKEQVNL